MTTGKLPFNGSDMISTLLAVAGERPRPPQELNPELPPPLCNLIERLLAKGPDERPSSAIAVVRAIEAIEQNATPAVPTKQPAGSRRLLRRLVAAAVLLGLLGAAYFLRPTFCSAP
jgi:serine/threonine protein kinase